MLGRRYGEREDVAHGFVEARVSTAPVDDRLVLVLEVVFDVTHLVVDGNEVVHGDVGALFDPERNGKESSAFYNRCI